MKKGGENKIDLSKKEEKSKGNTNDNEQQDEDVSMDYNLKSLADDKIRKRKRYREDEEEAEAKQSNERKPDIFLTGPFGIEREYIYNRRRTNLMRSMRTQEKDTVFGLSALGKKYKREHKLLAKSEKVLRQLRYQKIKRIANKERDPPQWKTKGSSKNEKVKQISEIVKSEEMMACDSGHVHVGEYSPCLNLHSMLTSDANLNDVLSDVKMLYPVDVIDDMKNGNNFDADQKFEENRENKRRTKHPASIQSHISKKKTTTNTADMKVKTAPAPIISPPKTVVDHSKICDMLKEKFMGKNDKKAVIDHKRIGDTIKQKYFNSSGIPVIDHRKIADTIKQKYIDSLKDNSTKVTKSEAKILTTDHLVFQPNETSLDTKNIEFCKNMKKFINDKEEGLMESYPIAHAFTEQKNNAKRRRWNNFVHFYLSNNLLPSGRWPIPASTQPFNKQITGISSSFSSTSTEDIINEGLPIKITSEAYLSKQSPIRNPLFSDGTLSSLSDVSTYIPNIFLDIKRSQLMKAYNCNLSQTRLTRGNLTGSKNKSNINNLGEEEEEVSENDGRRNVDEDDKYKQMNQHRIAQTGNDYEEEMDFSYPSPHLDVMFPSNIFLESSLKGTKVITDDEVCFICEDPLDMSKSLFDRLTDHNKICPRRKPSQKIINQKNIEASFSRRKHVRMEAPVLGIDGLTWKEIENNILRFQLDSDLQENNRKKKPPLRNVFGSDNLGVQRTVDKILLECAPHCLSQKDTESCSDLIERNSIQRILDKDCVDIVDHLLEDIFVKYQEDDSTNCNRKVDRKARVTYNWEDMLRTLDMFDNSLDQPVTGAFPFSKDVVQNIKLRIHRHFYPHGVTSLNSRNFKR